MSYGEVIKCPACLKDNDVDELERRTQYECWSSEYTYVTCIECEHSFEVACEHRGYKAVYNSFDIREFFKFHKIRVPKEYSHIWVQHYMRDLVLSGTAKMVVPDKKFVDQTKICHDAYFFAIKEWERILTSLESK